MNSKKIIKEADVISKLEDFNRFVKEVFTLSFIQKLSPSYGISLEIDKHGKSKIDLNIPDDESIKAIVSDLRRFFQNGNDTLRIHKLQVYYQAKCIEVSERRFYGEVMSYLATFNSEPSRCEIENGRITNEKVWEVFMYGRFSHRSKGTKDVHDAWEKDKVMYAILKVEFVKVLIGYCNILSSLHALNKKIIDRLKQTITNF